MFSLSLLLGVSPDVFELASYIIKSILVKGFALCCDQKYEKNDSMKDHETILWKVITSHMTRIMIETC